MDAHLGSVRLFRYWGKQHKNSKKNSINIEDLVPLKEVSDTKTEVSHKEVGKQSKKRSWKVV